MKQAILILGACCIFLALNAQPDFEGRKKINGTDLYMIITGKGEPLVVIHGGPGLNHSYFRPHLDELANAFTLIYYDQRASGLSATPSPDSISTDLLVEDLEAIRQELKAEKINILAHSWGAVLAVKYALKFPGKISHLILSNPTMLSREYDQEAAAFAKAHTTKEDSMKRAEIIAAGNLEVAHYEKLFRLSFDITAYERKNMSDLNLSLPENLAAANRALFTGLMKEQRDINYYDSLRVFTFPVLIVHGKADGIPYASVERLKKSISGSQLAVFEKSGHFPFIEEPELYLETVLLFLKQGQKQRKKPRN